MAKKLALGSAAKIAPATVTAPAKVLPDLTGTVGPSAPKLSVTAVPGGDWAHNTALKIADDEDFGEDVTEAVIAGETSKRRVYTVLWNLKQIFSDEELSSFPLLAPKFKDLTPSQANLFIDEYPTLVKSKDGKDKPGTGSRYNDLGNDLPWIKQWVDHKAYLVEARKDRTKAKPEQAGWSAARFDSEIEMYAQRIRDGIGMIKTAMRVHFHMVEINSFKQVGCALMTYAMLDATGAAMTGSNGQPMRDLVSTSNPLTLFSRTESDPDTQQPLSCSLSSSAFLALKPDVVATKMGGKDKVTYTELLASAGRVTSQDTGTTEPAIKSLDNVEGTMAELYRFLGQEHNASRLRTLISGKDKKGNPLMSDDYVATIVHLNTILDGIVTFPDFAARIKPAMAAVAQRELRERGIEPAQVKVA